MKLNVPGVTTFTLEKHRGVRIPDGKNTQNRSAITLWKHCREKHSSEIQQFEMNVTGVYSNDAMLRQISEGVKVNNVDEDSLMNSKNEWNYFHISRAVVTHGRVVLPR